MNRSWVDEDDDFDTIDLGLDDDILDLESNISAETPSTAMPIMGADDDGEAIDDNDANDDANDDQNIENIVDLNDDDNADAKDVDEIDIEESLSDIKDTKTPSDTAPLFHGKIESKLVKMGNEIGDKQKIKRIIVVKPENRLTPDKLSSFEISAIESHRSMQIAYYGNCLLDPEHMADNPDAVEMARRELKYGRCPLILRRPVGDSRDPRTDELIEYVEDWDPNEMKKIL